MELITLIARILAVIIAIVGVFVGIPAQTTLLLAFGAIAGLDVEEERRPALMLATIILFISGEALNEVPRIGDELGQLFGNLSDAYMGASLMVVCIALAARLRPASSST